MTLLERVKSADPKDIFYVGSASGFVFIGDAKEFFRDINDVSDAERDHLKSVLSKDVMCLAKFDVKYNAGIGLMDAANMGANNVKADILPQIAKECSRAIRELNAIPQSSPWLYAALNGTVQNLTRLFKACTNFPDDKKFLEDFVPFAEREVIDEYTRMEGGTVLLVPGDEIGRYWMREEYISKSVVED